MRRASRRTTGLAVAFAIGAALLALTGNADQSALMTRVGFVTLLPANSLIEEALVNGLRELGYVEGKNIAIERQSGLTSGNLASATAELVRTKPDVIVVSGTPATRAALDATKTIPVVFLAGDPVATGFAASLAQPGGNATGVSLIFTDLTAKRLELLRALSPKARRIGCLINSSNPVAVLQFEEAQRGSRLLGLDVLKLDVRDATELDTVLRALPRSRVDGILVAGDAFIYLNRTRIGAAAHKARIPAIFPSKEYQGDGVLVSYGPSLRTAAYKMAGYVDKILKGAKPADLPIEQLSKYELVIDLRVARELGIKVPQDLLFRADEVTR